VIWGLPGPPVPLVKYVQQIIHLYNPPSHLQSRSWRDEEAGAMGRQAEKVFQVRRLKLDLEQLSLCQESDLTLRACRAVLSRQSGSLVPASHALTEPQTRVKGESS